MKVTKTSLFFTSGFAILLLILSYFTERTDFTQYFLIYSGLFLLMVLEPLLRRKPVTFREVFSRGIFFRLIVLFSIPEFSDDFYRFFWDGALWNHGVNPFAHTPKEIMELFPEFKEKAMLANLNSADYHSVYPLVLQYLFAGAYKLSMGNLHVFVVLLRLVIVLSEVATLYFLMKILKFAGKSVVNFSLYAFNPLIIHELVGNIHFEALMVTGIAFSLYAFQKKNHFLAGVGLGLASVVKLIPLIFAPAYLFRSNTDTGIRIIGLTLFLLFPALFFGYLFAFGYFENYLVSLKLYFATFEFHASLYRLTVSIGELFGYYELKSLLQQLFPYLTFVVILGWSVAKRNTSVGNLFLGAYCIFLLFATTIHPWYLAGTIPLAVVGRYRFPIFWSWLIGLTYFTYQSEPYAEAYSLNAFIYFALALFLVYEMIEHRKIQPQRISFLQPLIREKIRNRAMVKFNLIHKRIKPEDKILDIGCGNGGVVRMLRDQGYSNVKTIDVVNLSYFDEVTPVIYNGEDIPFNDNSFDAVQILTVLHHAANPKRVVEEAKRVSSSKLIIMEDVYDNKFMEVMTKFMDSFVNFEFKGHVHQNKTEQEWEELFEELGLRITHKAYYRPLGVFKQVVYELEKS